MKLSTLLLVAVAACAAPETYDLVLANGRVMDPASGLDSIRHLGISAGKIAAISAEPLRGDTVIDRAIFEQPTLTSGGIPHVLVNGTFVVRDGRLVEGAFPGRAVRTTPATP